MLRWCRSYPAVFVASLAFITACGGGDPNGGGRKRNNGGTGGAGGTGGSAGTGGVGGIPGVGGFGGTGMFGGVGGAPPVVDEAAPPFVKDDTGLSGLPAATIDMLRTGGGECTVQPSYPYEGTMLPGGLVPPMIMFPGGSDATYLRFGYEGVDKVDYQFAAGPSNPGQVQIPREAWNEITRRTNRANLNVTFTVQSGGTLSTCTLHWKVAAGNMVGSLYYNTYQAPEPGIPGIGAIMRLTLGTQSEIYKQGGSGVPPVGPCYSCHSVSFNGRVLVSSFHNYTPFLQEFRVDKFDVTADVEPEPSGTLHNANFGALTPDGTRILSMGNPECTAGSDTFPRRPNNFPLVEGADVARMLDTASGMELEATGLDGAHYMWMPQFSPDGDKVVFNHAKAGASGTDRMELAMMDYDYDTNAFSNLRVLANATEFAPGVPTSDYAPLGAGAGPQPIGVDACEDPAPGDVASGVATVPMGSCNGPCYPAWPFFTPDGKGVVFSLTSDPDFAQAFPGRDAPSKSELWYVDVETLERVRLDNANRGLEAIDEENNYYPTVLPIAIGGYFWMFWTAVRDYGHLSEGRDPAAVPNSVIDAEKKRIWAAAIKPKFVTMEDENNVPMPLTDPSFPGFYVDGQSTSGNVRAFAALNPCLDNNAPCASGLDCCCGYCLVEDGAATGTCSCEPPACSKTNEKCETSDDCCPPTAPDEPANSCIGGFCTFVNVE
jgi:hypothetical protein